MRIAVFELEQWERQAFKGLSSEHEIRFSRKTLRAVNADRHATADILSPFIYSDLSANVLKRFRHLKLVATRSTGFDHIDVEYCQERGITVCNVPTYGENTVAEHVFALLLTISHKMFDAIERTRKGDFSQQGLQGFDLRGKTLGVIGTGNIGICVIEIARGFRMQVVAYDVRPEYNLASELGFRYVRMEELLESADIITLHVPATPRTHHLVSTKEFAMMKDGVVLINTARGSIVDTQALLHAIADGKVAAAGLDVLHEEPSIREEAELLHSLFRQKHNLEDLLADHILLRLRNIVITPHSAFNTREAVQRILDTTIDNIITFIQGKPQNVVGGTG
ncbi:MAG: hydroxyacid dehydrogenase [Dehalococcoidia bacterium]|jgi:D-lactate dehydrogenase|nr:MAG: hydroxyacid dehydrogenase [Dehalococcoidia bacterium]